MDRLQDLMYLDAGFVMDMVTEQQNDTYDWPEKAVQADFDNFKR